ncbi:hypothetical protein ACVWY3_003049 [Bradyrhizobium sp. USDA 4486]
MCRAPSVLATAKLNDIDPPAWLADVLARLPDHSAKRIDELLPGIGSLNASLTPLKCDQPSANGLARAPSPDAYAGCVRSKPPVEAAFPDCA